MTTLHVDLLGITGESRAPPELRMQRKTQMTSVPLAMAACLGAGAAQWRVRRFLVVQLNVNKAWSVRNLRWDRAKQPLTTNKSAYRPLARHTRLETPGGSGAPWVETIGSLDMRANGGFTLPQAEDISSGYARGKDG